MKWTIAVISVLPQRATELKRITGMLRHQIGDRDIELLINTVEESVGQKRQWCLENAKGEYISFVDDDDLVAFDYVDTIYPLLDGFDYVGFQLQMYKDGAKQKPTYHSLRYAEWDEDEKGYYRNVTHLNPIKRSIALQGTFEGDWAEDYNWAHQVQPKTEHYIDRPMYFYFSSTKYSLTRKHDGNT